MHCRKRTIYSYGTNTIYTYSSHQSEDAALQLMPTHRKKKRKRENCWRQNGSEQPGKLKSIGPALKTRQSHTIEYKVTKIVSQRQWEGNKNHAILRDSAAIGGISLPMSDQSIEGNLHWHIEATAQVEHQKEMCNGLHPRLVALAPARMVCLCVQLLLDRTTDSLLGKTATNFATFVTNTR